MKYFVLSALSLLLLGCSATGDPQVALYPYRQGGKATVQVGPVMVDPNLTALGGVCFFQEAMSERLEKRVKVVPPNTPGKDLALTVQILDGGEAPSGLPGPNTALVDLAMGDKGVKGPRKKDVQMSRLGYSPRDLYCVLTLDVPLGTLSNLHPKQFKRKLLLGDVMQLMDPIPGNGDPSPEQVQREYSRGVGRCAVLWFRELGLIPTETK